MLAVYLWLTLGWRTGALELIVEAALCTAIVGGGGGGRLARNVRALIARQRRRRVRAVAA